MRQIHMQPIREGSLHNLGEKHELYIVGSNMTNVIRLTDDELAALRSALTNYPLAGAHSADYGAACPDGCRIPGPHRHDWKEDMRDPAQNPASTLTRCRQCGAPSELCEHRGPAYGAPAGSAHGAPDFREEDVSAGGSA
jgi:hypothetical protein